MRTWNLAAALLLSGMATTAVVAAAEPLKESACAFLLEADGEESVLIEVPRLSILNPPKDQPRFVVEEVDGARLGGVVCWRSRPEFSEQDDRVTAAGFPLYVKEDVEEDATTLVLERTDVGHRIRQVDGKELTKRQQRRLIRLIERWNKRMKEEPSDGQGK